MSSSPEAEILREIERLIRKVATGQSNPNDVQLLQDLQKHRVEMMRPKAFSSDPNLARMSAMKSFG